MHRLDPKALGEHVDAMYRAAWAMSGSREDAEDIVQDTFARVLQRPRMVRGDDRSYLMQALRNTFYTRLRTASRRPQTTLFPDELEPVDARSPAPHQLAEAGEVLDAISRLPDDFRMALVAIDIVGLSYGEASRVLDVPEATITTRLYRARKRVVAEFPDPSDSREGPAAGRSLA